MNQKNRSIAIIGTGKVGIASAYALFNQRIANEIILVDLNREQAEGEAMDLMHGQSLVGNVKVRAGGYQDLEDPAVVVITAGVSQKSSEESRFDLLNRNAKVFKNIISKLDKYAPNAILVVATNPVDILTKITQHLSSRSEEHIIGTGTLLDTARFRSLLGQYYRVDPQSVHAYILGEHGDSEVPIWSGANIGGKLILNNTVLGTEYNQEKLEDLFLKAKNAAYDIIGRKGFTNSAIGVVIARIAKAILQDERNVLPTSVLWQGEYGISNVCMSLPCVIGINGATAKIVPQLNNQEIEGLESSATILKQNIESIQID